MKGVDILESDDSAIQRTMTAALRLLTVVAGVVILAGGVLLLVRQGDHSRVFIPSWANRLRYDSFRKLWQVHSKGTP
jgi:uncharacterized membrane protein